MEQTVQFGFIGAGNMGTALIRAMRQRTADILISDHTPAKAERLAKELGIRAGDNGQIAACCRTIFLAVKPQVLQAALDEVRETLCRRLEAGESVTLVTMAAGVTMETVQQLLGRACPIIRIMPNTPVAVGQGVVLYTAANIREEAALTAFLDAMAPAGQLVELSEKQIDAASAVSGCGPAYVYAFIHAMAMGGVRCGLKYDVALRLAAQTALGSAQMVLETGEHPESLKVKVCSPAGTTIEGVKALEEHAFGSAVMDAVSAAWRRTLELAEEK